MSSVPVAYIDDYGSMVGRGEVEAHVVTTISDWIVWYVAAYERAYRLSPRSTPVPPTPESVHGGIDFETWETALSPEIIVVPQPIGDVERDPDFGYGQWFNVSVGAICHDEGRQGYARKLADLYGTVLQILLVQQGAFGKAANGTDPFAIRTRLFSGARSSFVDDTVRDVVRSVVDVRTFVYGMGNDLVGPRTQVGNDPYAIPKLWPEVSKIEIEIDGESPTGEAGRPSTVIIDATRVPEETSYE